MRIEYQVIAAMALDAVAGDPRWLPHPVKLIGGMAARLEPVCRNVFSSEYAAGAAAALVTLGVAGATAWLVVWAATAIHPVAGDVVSILLLYTTFAARDLAKHGNSVFAALEADDLPEARRRAAMMVGRDTDSLDEAETARAAVESIAENTADGVTAPLMFAFIGGPAAAVLYKAVSTLDSTFGYRNERYAKFGCVSARLDDVVN